MVAVELDAQHRRRVALHPTDVVSQRRVPRGEFEHVAVDQLDGARPVGHDRRHGLERGDEVGEVEQRQDPTPRQRVQRQGHVEDGRQGPLAAAHELGEVEGAPGQQLVEVVAADPAHHPRGAGHDLGLVGVDDAVHRAVGPALDAGGRQLGGEFEALQRAQLGDLVRVACGEEELHGDHLIDRLAVLQGACAGAVVRHHAADGGAVGRRDVGRELQPPRREVGVQPVAHQPGFHPRGPAVGIDREDAVEVA